MEHTKEYQEENDPAKQAELKNGAFDRFMATVFLLNADQGTYGDLIYNYAIEYASTGTQDKYPKTLSAAVDVMSKVRRPQKKSSPTRDEGQRDTAQAEAYENSFAQGKMVCYICGKEGHISTVCPHKDNVAKNQWYKRTNKVPEAAQTHTQQDMLNSVSSDATNTANAQAMTPVATETTNWSLHQISEMTFNQKVEDTKDLLMLDSGSTFHLIANENFCNNIRESQTKVKMGTNAGSKIISEVADMPGTCGVSFDTEAIANILGLSLKRNIA